MMLAQTFPKEVQEGLLGGMQNIKAYQAALKEFHAHYGCTVKPFPEELEYSLDRVLGDDGDPTVASAGCDLPPLLLRLIMLNVLQDLG